MKRNHTIFFALAFVMIISSCSNPLNKTPDDFALTMFNIIKEKKYSEFESYFPTRDDFIKIIDKSSESEENKKVVKETVINDWMRKIEKDTEKSLDEIIEKGEKAGVNWNDAKFKTTEYKIKKKDENKSADIYIIFESGGNDFKIKLDDCVETERGWLMFDDPRFKTPSNENQ